MNYIIKLVRLLDARYKYRLLSLILFSILVSVIEVVGISAIMPFIDVATNFEKIHSNEYYQWAYVFFGFDSDSDFAIAFGLTLLGFYLFRGLVNLLHTYKVASFAQNIYTRITKRLFRAYLLMPYQEFTGKNSSYLSKTIITETSLLSVVIRDVLVMLSEILVVIFLYILMLLASWKITFTFTIVLAVKLFFLTQTVSKQNKLVGAVRAKAEMGFYEVINRTLGNFKNIKLQDEARIENVNIDFSKKVDQYAKANITHEFLNDFPRLFIETVGFSLIIFLLVFLLHSNQSSIVFILPTLSLFVLALYRLLPSVNRIINGYNSLMYHHKSIDIVDKELAMPQEHLFNNKVPFESDIELRCVGFFYHEKQTLSNINLTIKKGEKIAFIGESGSGKSTLVDLIIGLYRPSRGEVRVDSVLIDDSNLQDWRSQIGYIPQHVYLFDGTIAENVCFGRKLNEKLLDQVLKQANIFDFLQTKHGVSTIVGEGGIQLSGGQRQRIAIARALYGEPETLVLDEATSALDNETEKRIMDEIFQVSQDRTLIIVAHRLSTVMACDAIYKIHNGMLVGN